MKRIEYITEKIIKYNYGDNNEILFEIIFNKVKDAYVKKEKLNFIMPSFPGKSPNTQSCFSYLPDGGEYIALNTIKCFLKEVDNLYPYGTTFTIIHDGHFFEKLGITRNEQELNAYVDKIRDMLDSNIYSITIYDLFGNYNLNDAYNEFKKKYIDCQKCKIDCELLSKEILFTKYEFNLCLRSENISKNQIQKKAKLIAKESLIIKDALSRLISTSFIDSIRLSVHYQSFESDKMGFKLIPTALNRGTPWFYVIYKNSKEQVILGKKNWEFDSKSLVHNSYGFYYSIDENDVEMFLNNLSNSQIIKEKGYNR